jgi:hypothetical protein
MGRITSVLTGAHQTGFAVDHGALLPENGDALLFVVAAADDAAAGRHC